MKKKTRRKVVTPLPPPGMRPKLTAETKAELSLHHWATLDAIVRGDGTYNTMMKFVGGMASWDIAVRMMHEKNQEAYAEARQALSNGMAVTHSIRTRYQRTGKVGLAGVEYQQAKEALEWMDALAEVMDWHVAVVATELAQQYVDALTGAPQRNKRNADRDGENGVRGRQSQEPQEDECATN